MGQNDRMGVTLIIILNILSPLRVVVTELKSVFVFMIPLLCLFVYVRFLL